MYYRPSNFLNMLDMMEAKLTVSAFEALSSVSALIRSLISELYNFTTDSFDYFMFDIGTKESNHLRRLVVYNKKNRTLITDLFYMIL